METNRVRVTIDGTVLYVPAMATIVQAYAMAGIPLLKNVGCVGQGVCGSCRCLVRGTGSREVETELACETLVQDGMQGSFIDYFTPRRPHVYQIEKVADSWQVNVQLNLYSQKLDTAGIAAAAIGPASTISRCSSASILQRRVTSGGRAISSKPASCAIFVHSPAPNTFGPITWSCSPGTRSRHAAWSRLQGGVHWFSSTWLAPEEY